MGIDGSMKMTLLPGAHGNPNARQQRYDDLKRIITKLNQHSKMMVSTIKVPILNGYCDGFSITVPDNRNFWFQLTQLPKMLIPYFWKLSEEELEQKRMELLKDGWGVEHMKKLAMQIFGGVIVNERYDSVATGHYTYTIGPDNSTEASIHYTFNDGVLNHADALQKQIEMTKTFYAQLCLQSEKENKPLPTIEPCGYWGMFK